MRALPPVPGQLIGGPPLDRLPQPGWLMPVNVSVPADPNTVRSHTSLAVSAAVSPDAART